MEECVFVTGGRPRRRLFSFAARANANSIVGEDKPARSSAIVDPGDVVFSSSSNTFWLKS